MDVRSNADKIIDALREAGKPLKPLQIAEISGVGDDVVRTTVRQMLLKKELVQPGYGLYSLPHDEPKNVIQLISMPGASEDELRRAMSQLPWACALVDEDWRFYFATASYINAYGLEDQMPIVGKTIGEIMPDVQSELTPGITAILDRGEAYHTPEPQPWPRADGKLWELVYSLYPWRYDGKRGTIIECRSIRVDGAERIPQTRYVRSNVQADPDQGIGKSTYKQDPKAPVYMGIDSSTLEDKIFSLVDLDAMKQLIDTGAGYVQEGFLSTFRRMHDDGNVYRFTVRVDVERERPKSTSNKPQNEGPPRKG